MAKPRLVDNRMAENIKTTNGLQEHDSPSCSRKTYPNHSDEILQNASMDVVMKRSVYIEVSGAQCIAFYKWAYAAEIKEVHLSIDFAVFLNDK